jgi:hypothetical protein
MQKILFVIASLLIMPLRTYAATVTDCLIDTDIGEYTRSYPGSCPKGSGIVAGTGHFKPDHIDYACDIRYYNETIDNGVEVQVTNHSGSESDKWLGHELDAEFRNYYGIPGDSYAVVLIDGNTVLEFGSAGWDYRWISGSNVIKIEYKDAQMTKPEPLEIVKAYLAKHPSTLATMTLKQLRSTENKTTWIKDEMDRRLWLCDKWFYQMQLKKVEDKQVYKESVKSMNIFLDYREKYYGVKASDEKNLLASYLSANNGTSIKTKLTEYKDWWTANKEKVINL